MLQKVECKTATYLPQNYIYEQIILFMIYILFYLSILNQFMNVLDYYRLGKINFHYEFTTVIIQNM